MNKLKLSYLLDAVIGLAFLLSGVTGLAFLLMGEGGYQGGRNPGFATAMLGLSRGTWSDLHTLGSVVMIAGVVVHIVLHWNWIACATKKMLPRRAGRAQGQACEVIV
ncbi:MAG: hypothetical protein DRJ03_26005 [Chloroflexi bacterium]|nr:MAG: hypothetical protein DRI81_16045 [Chloroflexota bacterium]RLC77940.1 MAG: hypothetical protein DRJ03_26005 [Chloroflexota bacterium]